MCLRGASIAMASQCVKDYLWDSILYAKPQQIADIRKGPKPPNGKANKAATPDKKEPAAGDTVAAKWEQSISVQSISDSIRH